MTLSFSLKITASSRQFSKNTFHWEFRMKIRLNGQEKELSESWNLNNIIEKYCKETRHVIAELNGHIIKKPRWEEILIQDGDSIELINLVGGG